jgi:2-polyprenyl-3-methyl-5-hydroxy-6-metoxy-1,4-benzoquinol methylase
MYENYFKSTASAPKARDFMVDLYAGRPWLGQPYRFIASSLSGPAHVLDVGCGEGYFLAVAKRLLPEATLYACDLEKSFVRDDLSGVLFTQVDLEAQPIPYEDNVFDHINCMHVIEHVNNPVGLFSEIARVLKPGGTAYVEAPDVRLTFVPHLPLVTGVEGVLNFWDDPTHKRPYSRPALARLASMTNLETISCFYVRRLGHLLALPLALFTRGNYYKAAVLHALGFFCGIIVRKPASIKT